AVYRLLPTPPRPTLFPYTTLFRSQLVRGEDDPGRALDHPGRPGDTPELLAAVLGAPEPLLRALRGDAVEHDHEGVVELRRHGPRSEEHTSELQSQSNLVCCLLLEK